MEPSAIVQGVSFRQNPRPGQRAVWLRQELKDGNRLNIKLPTGYGKTYTACGVYSILKHFQRAQRMFYIVPSDAQRTQFIQDAPLNMSLASADGPMNVTDIGFLDASRVIARHRKNECQVFVSTVQSLIQPAGKLLSTQLLETGQWLIVVDEYHHYGIDKSWGSIINGLPRAFLLAMSATPHRPGDDSAFGSPDVRVTYREAQKAGDLKRLIGHSYDYKIDAIDENGELITYTTEELADEAGGDQPERIEKLRIKRRMRWSPKYVSPLVRIPIERMQNDRLRSGIRLQALVSAMCVSHADLVCSQLRSAFPELQIDWVGTGDNGKTPEQNTEVLKRFCPPKDEHGRRDPKLDVLVHVGMAGEGLDAINVSEIVLLRTASLNNQTMQIIGRASRPLPGVVGNVSFDASTDLAKDKYMGEAIMDAMDFVPASPTDDDTSSDEDQEPRELPDEPNIVLTNLELIGINSGEAGVQRMARVLESIPVTGIAYEKLTNLNDPEWAKIIEVYKNFQAKEAAEFDERAIIAQWRDAVDGGVSSLTSLVIRHMTRNGVRIERTLVGDIKKRINTKKKTVCGEINNDIVLCKMHWQWIKNLEHEIRASNQVPQWLL